MIKNRWVILALVFLGILISYIDRGNLSIAAPVMMREFGFSNQLMGLLLSAFFWTYGAFQLPAGWAIDRLGIRKAYFLGFLVWSLASAGMALSQGAASVMGLRLLLGVAESVGPLASLAFIRLAFGEKERGLPVGIYIAGQTIGPACGALAGSAIIATAGWRVLFAVTGLTALLWLPLWWRFARLENRVKSERQRVAWQWGKVLTSRVFWALSGCVFLFSYYWYFVLTWIPTYLNAARGFSMTEMGRILAIPLFTMAPVNIGLGWLADRLIARGGRALRVRIIFAAVGFLGAGLIVLLRQAQGRNGVLLVLVISICAFGAGSTNFWAVVQQLAPAALTARVIAYFNTLSQAAGAAAPIITGYTLGGGRDYSAAILLAGGSAVGAAVLLGWCGTRPVCLES